MFAEIWLQFQFAAVLRTFYFISLPVKKERKQICVCHNFFLGLTMGARVQVESLVFECAARVFLK